MRIRRDVPVIQKRKFSRDPRTDAGRPRGPAFSFLFFFRGGWGKAPPTEPGRRALVVDQACWDKTRSRGRFGRGTSVRNGRAGPTADRRSKRARRPIRRTKSQLVNGCEGRVNNMAEPGTGACARAHEPVARRRRQCRIGGAPPRYLPCRTGTSLGSRSTVCTRSTAQSTGLVPSGTFYRQKYERKTSADEN